MAEVEMLMNKKTLEHLEETMKVKRCEHNCSSNSFT